MKFLALFSGSIGHFLGLKPFVNIIGVNDQIIFASNLPLPQNLNETTIFHQMNGPPAFLDYELLHYKDTRKVIQLLSNQVYYHGRKKDVDHLINFVRPDVIILDNHSFTDALIIAELYRKSGIKILFYQTRLSTVISHNSQYGGVKRNDLKFLPGSIILRRKKYNLWKKRIMMPVLNNDHHIRKMLSQLNFRLVKLNRRRNGINSLSFIPEIILSGSDLSFFQTKNQFYSGLCLSEIKPKTDIGNDKTKILVSSGSRSHSYTDFGAFLDGIHDLVTHYFSIIFYLHQNLRDKISGDNISYYSWDTYHEHLFQSNLHITHGGINSIKDSLSNSVPMLIVPLDRKSDQIHNSLMFEKLGLAKVWNVKNDSPADVRLKAEDLLTGGYSERIREYVLEDRKRYPVEKVRQEFMELIQDERWEIRNW